MPYGLRLWAVMSQEDEVTLTTWGMGTSGPHACRWQESSTLVRPL